MELFIRNALRLLGSPFFLLLTNDLLIFLGDIVFANRRFFLRLGRFLQCTDHLRQAVGRRVNLASGLIGRGQLPNSIWQRLGGRAPPSSRVPARFFLMQGLGRRRFLPMRRKRRKNAKQNTHCRHNGGELHTSHCGSSCPMQMKLGTSVTKQNFVLECKRGFPTFTHRAHCMEKTYALTTLRLVYANVNRIKLMIYVS